VRSKVGKKQSITQRKKRKIHRIGEEEKNGKQKKGELTGEVQGKEETEDNSKKEGEESVNSRGGEEWEEKEGRINR
jgi:hypothetical protein